MKRKLFLLVLAMVCLGLLSGCGCRHEWQEATCLDPKICTLCQETEGEALGHSWQEANCESPKTCAACALTEGDALGHDWQEATCQKAKTCSRCALTEGEPVAHRFSSWEVGETEMIRRCSDCAAEEKTAADWSVYLSDLLAGRWVCTEAEVLGDPLDLSVYFPQTPFLEVGADQSIRYFNGKTEHHGNMLFIKQTDKGDFCANVFQAVQDGTPQAGFAHQITREGAEEQEKIISYATVGSYTFAREPEEDALMRRAVTGSWKPVEAEHSQYAITFRDDYSFTIVIDGESFEGVWSPDNISEDINRYSYRLQYIRDNRWEFEFAWLTPAKAGETAEATISMRFDNDVFVDYTLE